MNQEQYRITICQKGINENYKSTWYGNGVIDVDSTKNNLLVLIQ